MPHRHALNLLSFGAKPDGVFDNADIINDALEVAREEGRRLVIPEGVFAFGALLYADGVEVLGQYGSELYALDVLNCAFNLSGVSGAVEGLRFGGVPTTEREGGWKAARIVVSSGAEGWRVTRNEVAGGGAVGIWISVDAHDGTIARNYVHDTMADSIHLIERSHHLKVWGNKIRRSGDDGISVVSYRKHDSMVHHVEAWGNDIRDNVWGRCMTVVGGSNVSFHHNFLDNNSQSAGFYMHQEENYETFACIDVHIYRNTVRNCGSIDKGHYAISASASEEWPNQRITIERNVVVIDDDRSGIDIRSNCLDSRAMQNVVQIDTGEPMRLAAGVSFTPYTDGPVGYLGDRNQSEDEEGFR